MSRRRITVIEVVIVLLAISSTILCTSCQSEGPVMTDGPGVLYLYSPT